MKKLTMLILAITICFVFTGCDNKPSENSFLVQVSVESSGNSDKEKIAARELLLLIKELTVSNYNVITEEKLKDISRGVFEGFGIITPKVSATIEKSKNLISVIIGEGETKFKESGEVQLHLEAVEI